jgi:hypothetical protein
VKICKIIILGLLKIVWETVGGFCIFAVDVLLDPFLFKLSAINILLSALAAKSHFPFHHIFWLWDFLIIFVVIWIIFFLLVMVGMIKSTVTAWERKD